MMNDAVLHDREHAGAKGMKCTRSGQGQPVGPKDFRGLME